MKKAIIASITGVAATVAMLGTARGDGFVVFENYNYSTDAKVTQQIGGAPVDETYIAGFKYGFGTITDESLLTLAPNTVPFHTPPTIALGYFQGGIATIPGYTSGPITFEVLAYNGADYSSSSSRGASSLFTLSSIATEIQPVGEFGAALTAWTVHSAVPEPSTFALMGLGIGVLLFLRRRKGRGLKSEV